MVHEGATTYAPHTNWYNNNPRNPSARSKVSSQPNQHRGNFVRESRYQNFAIESAQEFPPLQIPGDQPNSFRDKRNNKESMNNHASLPSQQLLPLPLPPPPPSQIQPSVTRDHQKKEPDLSSSQSQPSENQGTKTSTNISDPSASSSSTAAFSISFGTIPSHVETTKPSSLTRPLTATTAKPSSPATLSTTSTSRPSQLPGDTENGYHEWKKCRSCHNHVKDCCWQSILTALSHQADIAALGHKSTNVIKKGSQ